MIQYANTSSRSWVYYTGFGLLRFQKWIYHVEKVEKTIFWTLFLMVKINNSHCQLLRCVRDLIEDSLVNEQIKDYQRAILFNQF